MTEYEKFKEIYEEIDILLQNARITSEDSAFKTWRTRAERFLKNKYGDNSPEYTKLLKRWFHTGIYPSSQADDIRACRNGLETTKAEFQAYFDDYEDEKDEDTDSEVLKPSEAKQYNYSKVFIAHGHNEGLKESVARLLEKQGIEAIILHEQPNQGRTIIEKFENYSDVGAAICLFTSDDDGKSKKEEALNPRARQNVVFEAGFFMGRLGRERTIILAEQGVELPSDMQGIVYTDSDYWQMDVLTELDTMGYNIDFNVFKRKR